MKKEAALVLLLIAMIACSPLSQVDVPITQAQKPVHVTVLDNGLTVSVKEAHSIPLVTIQFWVHVGSKNERPEHRGIAHIFEHIWFKGTESQPVGSFHKRVESLGGELNAMTSLDWTMYYVTLPSDKFDDIFPYMVDLLMNPAFDPVEIEKEKEVVTEEQRFSENEPERYLDDHFARLLVQEHAYGQPIIGYKETIMAPTPEEINDFYNTWYVPNNMNIVIAGDVDTREIVRKIDSAFANFKPKQLPEQTRPQEPPVLQPRYNSSFRDVGYTYIAIGYHGPSSNDMDRYAYEVMSAIFDKGESSRLQKLKQENIIVRGRNVYLPLNELGVMETIAVVEPEKSAQARAALILELTKLKTQPVSQEELKRAKQLIKSTHIKSKEEIFQVGFDVGEAWIEGDIDHAENYIQYIDSVTAEDIKRVANKYFTAYTIYEVKPKV